jgi:copper chaperone CopZ
MKDKAVMGSSIAAAVAASLCCIGPFLALILGISSSGVVSAFGPLRPYLLGLALLLLIAAFYLSYRKRDPMCEDRVCKTVGARRTRSILLTVTTLFVMLFALFPYYSGILLKAQAKNLALAGEPQVSSDPSKANEATTTILINGMTCGGCAVQVRSALEKAPGVKSADVSYEKAQAVIVYDRGVTNPDAIRRVIEATGYGTGDAASQPPNASDVNPSEENLREIELNELREQFNSSKDSVRVVAILSPTCPACKSGRGVVGSVFDKFDSKQLKGFVVWLPMLARDNASSAGSEAQNLGDGRISQGWDPERKVGEVFAKRLKLRGTAWDVYLLYAPGIKWEADEPPSPTFWMHQLKAETGASSTLCLNPARLSEEVQRLLKGESQRKP